MHKIVKTVLALVVGATLAMGVPLAASASPVTSASAVSAHSVPVSHNVTSYGSGSYGSHNSSHYGKPVGHIHKKPHPTKPAYPPTKPPKPPKPPHHSYPFFWGGFWWFPFIFPAHTFHPGSIVHIFITGFGGFSFFGTVQADESGSITLGTAASDGSLNAQLKASGGKDLAGQSLNATISDSAGTTLAQTITVPAASAKDAAATTSVKSADPGTLAQSGTYISLATIWGAVGLIALGAAFVIMRSIIRRKERTRA